jgi:hypothetical protein
MKFQWTWHPVWVLLLLISYVFCTEQELISSNRRLQQQRNHPFHSDACLDLLTTDLTSLQLNLHDVFIIIPVFNIKDNSLLVESVSDASFLAEYCLFFIATPFLGQVNSE